MQNTNGNGLTIGTYPYWINIFGIPQIDEANHGIYFIDFDGNGHLDRMVASFDQFVDPASISYAGLTVQGYIFDTSKSPNCVLTITIMAYPMVFSV